MLTDFTLADATCNGYGFFYGVFARLARSLNFTHVFLSVGCVTGHC